ncbi:MAG: FAD-binding protein [Chitinophagaceae bacterium]|nr:MAG: FAD-binding protein [Chitinophagaceae bacterium]
MKKRTFLKLSASAMISPFVAPLEDWMPQEKLKNWAGNLTYSTSKIAYPKTVAEVQKIVKSHERLKVLGSKHCFNTIADTRDFFISLRDMNKVVKLDEAAKTVTIEGGMNYGTLSPLLERKGFALHNLASLPHISVAGACTTATHGSGVKNGNLSSGVAALEIVTAAGDVVELSRAKDGEKFEALVVGLGAIGVITKVTLNIVPTFKVKQYVYLDLPLSQLKENFEAILSSAYSVSLFTDWQTESVNEVWIKAVDSDKTDFSKTPEFFGGKAATKNMHPIAALSAENCTEQMGVPGPWFDRLPHFKMGFTPSSGVELQAEYFVPRKSGLEAYLAIAKLGKEIGPHLFISEIRTIEADNFWMSPCYGQPSLAIHFTLKQDWPNVSKLLPKIEAALEPFGAKPHWGKMFTLSPSVLQSRYAKLDAFKKLVLTYDPNGKFRNEFLNTNLYS